MKTHERCTKCEKALTLVQSSRIEEDDTQNWLVKVCLTVGCGGHQAEDVVRLYAPDNQA